MDWYWSRAWWFRIAVLLYIIDAEDLKTCTAAHHQEAFKVFWPHFDKISHQPSLYRVSHLKS